MYVIVVVVVVVVVINKMVLKQETILAGPSSVVKSFATKTKYIF